MRRMLLPSLALLLIVGTGVVHGMRTGRWQPGAALTDAAARLGTIPTRIGDWEGEEVPLKGREPTGVAGHFCRRYTNARTGEAVTMFLVCGRPGPIAIHTPDVCYAASGYATGTPIKYAPRRENAADFWTTDMVRTTNADRSQLRIFWAWNAGNGWQADDQPRLHFAAAPVLFKMYLLRELSGVGDPSLDRDPVVSFAQCLLPALNPVLFPDVQ